MTRRKKGNRVHGWIFLDKPLGLGSTQAVAMVRRAFNAQKAGHAGTLDPLATGLLAIALGEATKTVPYMMDADKTYTFTVKWGEATTTCDGEGEISDTSPVRPTRSQIETVLTSFLGTIEQAPPAYSAIKIGGQRAYDLARAGQVPEMKLRQVHVYSLKLVDVPDEDHASFEVHCGKGTYVRSLARDLALALGTVGHVRALRRVHCGGISIADSIALSCLDSLQLDELTARLKPLEAVLNHMPIISLDVAQAEKVSHGNSIMALPDNANAVCKDEVLLMHLGRPVAIALSEDGRFKPVRVFVMDATSPS